MKILDRVPENLNKAFELAEVFEYNKQYEERFPRRSNLDDDDISYLSLGTIASIPPLAKKNGVAIHSFSFSVAQNGKSSCDRVAAQVKRKLRDFVARGNNIKNAKELFSAISQSGLKGLSVYRATVKREKTEKAEKALGKLLRPKMEGISGFGHFVFDKNTIRVWKMNGIGDGRLYTDLSGFTRVLKIEEEGGFLASSESSKADEASIQKVSQAMTEMSHGAGLSSKAGWALRLKRKRGVYSKKAKRFAEKLFQLGDVSGRKMDPAEVERLMKEEESIKPYERMNAQQIRSYFGTLSKEKKAAKEPKAPKRRKTKDKNEEDEDEDEEMMLNEDDEEDYDDLSEEDEENIDDFGRERDDDE
ncbi:hypothetical protein PRIPAC_78515 [Pristionchus pacificus]|uniref:Uncharacterized protein n=1 Tax=Pristionchus pacificus TaxID=54126 RepID=A0A2A6C3A9_PRIPA|nr:hypothetical protein PRIPAC_78515 [Pristionchus pacificus]|eukprot:PDM72513.1 hypothetical protein PRIPAC_38947 [Pristionchus pacificus]